MLTDQVNQRNIQNSTSRSNKSHLHYKTFDELEVECLTQMTENGIPFSGPLKETPPEKPYRFSIDNKKNEPDEFYFCNKWEFKGHNFLRCTYGTWVVRLR